MAMEMPAEYAWDSESCLGVDRGYSAGLQHSNTSQSVATHSDIEGRDQEEYFHCALPGSMFGDVVMIWLKFTFVMSAAHLATLDLILSKL